MSYLVFAWIATFGYGIEVIISKLLSKYAIANPWKFNFYWSFLIAVFGLPFAFYHKVVWPADWGSLIAVSAFYALSGVFFILCLYRLDVSVFSPLFNFRMILSVFLGALIFGETLSSWQLFLIVIILVSGIFVTLDERWSVKSFLNRSILLALFYMIVLSLMGILLKMAIAKNGYWSVTIFMPIIAQAFLLLTIPFFKAEVFVFKIKSLGLLTLLALLGTASTFAANRAYEANVGLSTVIISLPISMIIAIFLSRIAPDLLEKHPFKVYLVRLIAATVMITSAVKLSLGTG